MKRTVFLLGLVGVLAASACSDDDDDLVSPPAADATIVQGASGLTATAYNPNPLNISLATNAEVTWRNDDNTTHTVTEDTGLFDLDNISAGQTASFTFTAPGTFTYHCDIHPNMVGTVIVGP